MLHTFLNDEGGSTGIEYGMIVTVMSSLVGVAFFWFGDFLSWGFQTMGECIQVSFDPECFSASSNRGVPTRSGDPAWWPRE